MNFMDNIMKMSLDNCKSKSDSVINNIQNPNDQATRRKKSSNTAPYKYLSKWRKNTGYVPPIDGGNAPRKMPPLRSVGVKLGGNKGLDGPKQCGYEDICSYDFGAAQGNNSGTLDATEPRYTASESNRGEPHIQNIICKRYVKPRAVHQPEYNMALQREFALRQGKRLYYSTGRVISPDGPGIEDCVITLETTDVTLSYRFFERLGRV